MANYPRDEMIIPEKNYCLTIDEAYPGSIRTKEVAQLINETY
jgi:hypothetical protein